ncbi:M23 family metallopeptidase [Streptomyces sp. SID10815]|nr:M23 family metallopeptidase [Streptomyces sp. SID10815]NEA51270.1 M23 family metallopeptidase [Streptomyces sp. SID10815]
MSRPRTAGYSRRTALAAPVVEAKEKLVNDRHPSGAATTPAPASEDASAPYAPYGGQDAAYGDFTTYDEYGATGFHTGAYAAADYRTDPGYGIPPDANAAVTGAYDTTQWSTGSHPSPHGDAYAAQHHAAYDTGAYDTTAWATGYQHPVFVPQQSAPADVSGQWDASAWLQNDPQDAAETVRQWDWNAQPFDTQALQSTQTFDTGAYDATQWNTGGAAGDETTATGLLPEPRPSYDDVDTGPHADDGVPAADQEQDGTGELPAVTLLEDQEEIIPVPVPAPRAAGRSRRRQPAKRSALLTVAVPSVCVLGVAGAAAASVGTFTGDGKETSASAADAAHPVQPATANNKLDTQLQGLSAGANDFADRASRTQERIDLKAQQVAEQKRAAQEAARKERMRPKFLLPVTQRGLSAYFGQAGVNWMSVHTGIDFPVSYGTTVMAATDGTVRTQWNSAYGNMLILTAKDGTETWYCHLSSYRVPPGTAVKAGDPIAYSGNSGNSTGPHLHFEVRPAGGSPIDPLPWLRSHGLDPT